MAATERHSFNIDGNTIYAGGLIIYRINNGELELLLMKSRGKYEEFGGTINREDKDIFDTVAREVDEESNGVIKYDSVIDRIKTCSYVCAKKSKYIVFLLKANEYEKIMTSNMFGNREIHDNIERTVHWIKAKNFYNFVKQKEVNFRIVSKALFDKINEIEFDNGIKDISKYDNIVIPNDEIDIKIDRKVYLF